MKAADFVESYFDAWNEGDPVGVADHLAADGVYYDVPENVQRTHDELIVNLRGFFETHQHRYELIGDILRGENTIAFQYQTWNADTLRNDDNNYLYRGSEFITMSGDSAMEINDYYDTPGLNMRGANRLKYAKSGLAEEQLQLYKTRLAEIMATQRAYLRSDLTLPRLAQELDCSVNHLSQVINAGFGMSFFDFLNRYRIEYAKQLLAEPESEDNAILSIAFTVGFNSNSAFYAAFKKRVGKTPAQFRRSHVNANF